MLLCLFKYIRRINKMFIIRVYHNFYKSQELRSEDDKRVVIFYYIFMLL